MEILPNGLALGFPAVALNPARATPRRPLNPVPVPVPVPVPDVEVEGEVEGNVRCDER